MTLTYRWSWCLTDCWLLEGSRWEQTRGSIHLARWSMPSSLSWLFTSTRYRFSVFGKFSLAAFLLAQKACRFKSCPKGWPPKARPIESPRCKVTQMAVLIIHRDLSEMEVISRQYSGVHDCHLGTFLSWSVGYYLSLPKWRCVWL